MLDATKNAATDAERLELEQLSSKLAVRHSMTHYAVGLVATFVCLVAAGISVKLGRDLAGTTVWYLYFPSAVLALACMAVAARSFLKGQRLKEQERSQFRRLLELRAKAGLD